METDLKHPESRRLALYLTGTRDSVLVLMNRMGRALGRFEDKPGGTIPETERRSLLADVETTHQEVPTMLLANTASVLITLGNDEEHRELETLERLAEQGESEPMEMAAKLAQLVARILDRRMAERNGTTGAAEGQRTGAIARTDNPPSRRSSRHPHMQEAQPGTST